MASRNSKKSPGLRLLWIPGSRKSHPKGRFGTTNKHISYTTPQKKSEVWSLGGSIVHRNLLQAEPDTRLLDGPSTSGISSLTYTTVASSAAAATSTASSSQCLESHGSLEETNETSTLSNNQENQQNSPTTPNSSSSTAPLMSPPLSPLEQNTQLSSNITQPSITNNSTTKTAAMPAKSHQTSPIPVIVTATTTDSIMGPNRFSLLAGKDIVTSELDIYSLPSPPTNSNENLNDLSGTTNNTSQNGSINNSPVKKQQRRHSNDQGGDVNSIESITEDTASDKIPSDNLDWIDAMVQDQEDRETLMKPKKKKAPKDLDQLDGIPLKENAAEKSAEEEDDVFVKCLYYTLLCCECTIS